MKKLVILTALLISTATVVHAQEQDALLDDKELAHNVLNAVAILLTIYLASSFILSLVKLFLSDRLQRSMLEKQTPENIVAKLLPRHKSEKQRTIKWFFLLFASSIGLTTVYLTQPLGFHSVLIVSFSTAFGFLAYFQYLKSTKNTDQ